MELSTFCVHFLLSLLFLCVFSFTHSFPEDSEKDVEIKETELFGVEVTKVMSAPHLSWTSCIATFSVSNTGRTDRP
jgi:hypothetical protein